MIGSDPTVALPSSRAVPAGFSAIAVVEANCDGVWRKTRRPSIANRDPMGYFQHPTISRWLMHVFVAQPRASPGAELRAEDSLDEQVQLPVAREPSRDIPGDCATACEVCSCGVIAQRAAGCSGSCARRGA